MAARKAKAAKPAKAAAEAAAEAVDAAPPKGRPALSVVREGLDAQESLRIVRSIQQACEFLAFLNPTMAALVRTVRQVPGYGLCQHGSTTKAAAWASRTTCFYASGFADFKVGERAGVVLHEYTHVALGHGSRAARIAKGRDGLDSQLFNIAADLVINTWIHEVSIKAKGALSLPADTISVHTLAEMFERSNVDLMTSRTVQRRGIASIQDLAEQSTETVHAVLRDLRYDNQGAAELLAKRFGDGPLGEDVRAADGEDDKAAEDAHRNIVRSLSAMAGSDKWGFASNVLTALPKSRVDWRRQLRSMVTRQQGGDQVATWSRTSRRQPCFGDVRVQGSTRTETGNPVAIFDTSGSIGDDIVKAFMAECQTIANLINNPVTVLEADVVVHRTSTMAPNGPRFQALKDMGRGGTDFTEALQAAERLKPSIIVYLTDLEAPEPRFRPKTPVIWCAVGDAEPPGFGRVVRIPRD